MKKLSPISMLVITLLSLFIGSTIIARPISSLAQPPDPGSDGLLNASDVDSIQTEQLQRAALASNADGFLYALRDVSGGGNLIYGFKADALTGALSALPGFPVTTGGLGSFVTVSELMAFDATNSRLFVVNNGSDTISAYAVNRADGSLAELSYSPFSIAPGNKDCVAVHPSGSPLVVGNGTDSNVASFNINAVSATEASGSPFGTGVAPFSCAFSQNGSYVYSGGNSGTDISGFSVDAVSGVLTPLSGSPFASGASGPAAYVTDESGRLFSANVGSNQVRGFTTSSGIPTGVSGNPFTSGLSEAIHGVLHPAGFYMVADRTGDQVGVYKIAGSGSATTLTAVTGSPFASGGTFTDVLALSRSAAFLYAANGNSRNITIYSVNAGTGALSGASTQPLNTLGNSGQIKGMAFAPIPEEPTAQGGFVYALQAINGSSNQIYGFQVDSSSGTLFQLPGFPISTGSNGSPATASELMVYDAANSRLFVVNNGSDTISAYAVNRTDGSLTELSYSPFSIPPGVKGCIAVHPSGSPLVMGNSTDSNVASFNINAVSATEASGSPFGTGVEPFSCAFSQNGSYVYSGGNSGTDISGFSVDAVSGVLTPLSGSPFASGASGPAAYVTDESGRLFSANVGSNQVRGFTTSSGIPTGVSGNPFTSGLSEAIHGVLHPAGYYMVADRGGDQVGAYKIAGSGPATTLTAVAGSPFASGGLFTDVLALNDNGKYLFAANGDSKNISSFSVDPGDGSLSGTSIQPIFTVGDTGIISGMAYAPPLSYVYLPIIVSD